LRYVAPFPPRVAPRSPPCRLRVPLPHATLRTLPAASAHADCLPHACLPRGAVASASRAAPRARTNARAPACRSLHFAQLRLLLALPFLEQVACRCPLAPFCVYHPYLLPLPRFCRFRCHWIKAAVYLVCSSYRHCLCAVPLFTSRLRMPPFYGFCLPFPPRVFTSASFCVCDYNTQTLLPFRRLLLPAVSASGLPLYRSACVFCRMRLRLLHCYLHRSICLMPLLTACAAA